MQVTYWHSGEIRTKRPFLSDSCFFSRENNRWRYPDTPPFLLTFPFSGWLRFPLWSKGRSPSHGKNRRGTRQISRPNNARRNFLSEIAVPNIIDNWYDTRLVALLEFYRDPTRERNCLSSRIVSFYRGDIQGAEILWMPRMQYNTFIAREMCMCYKCALYKTLYK